MSACSPFLGVLSFVCSKTLKSNQTHETLQEPAQQYAQLTMNNSIFTEYSHYYLPHIAKIKGGGRYCGEAVVKAKVVYLEEEIREGFSIMLWD